MPMRGELAVPATRSDKGAAAAGQGLWVRERLVPELWVLVGFCAVGLLIALLLTVYAPPGDETAMLVF